MSLPFPANTFDVAVMPLVIFFVPEPAQGVAEMARVVSPGGAVSAYAWDMTTGGFPYEALLAELRALNITLPSAPRPEASRIDVMLDLWSAAGLRDIDTCEIQVERTFADFDDYWTTVHMSPSVGRVISELSPADHEGLKVRMRAVLPADAHGHITYGARANAVKGYVTP
jgi:ubiquinone/menaquinone biosynthesis C-methylase UbiE